MIKCEVTENVEKFEDKDNDGIPIPSNIEDGGEHLLKCTTCSKNLVTILRSRPGLDFDSTYKAKCYDCGGFSDEIYIKGGTSFIFPGSETKRECFMESFEIIDGVTILKMKKG